MTVINAPKEKGSASMLVAIGIGGLLLCTAATSPKPKGGAVQGVKGQESAVTIFPGVPWFDAERNLVNAHGIGIYKEDNVYYMVGEKRTDANNADCGGNPEDTFVGVNMYSSTDLANWNFVGTPVLPDTGPLLSSKLIGERPKLYFNAKTQKYFILVKTMKSGGSDNNYVLSTADNVTGPYKYVGPLMYGKSNPAAGDVNVFIDTDETGYLIVPNGKIFKMAADYLSIEGVAVDNIWGSAVPWMNYCQSEGPGFFKANGVYFLLGSHGTFWSANDNFYASAPAITGPWTYHGAFAPEGTMTWNSQSGFVLPVEGKSDTTYIYMGDRWVNGHLTSSSLIWLPIKVSKATMSIASYPPAWTLHAAEGTWRAIDPASLGLSVNDHQTGRELNHFTYTGKWSHLKMEGSYNGDVTSSANTGDTATITFAGTQVLLYSSIDRGQMGIMGVTLLDNRDTPVTPEVFPSLRTDAAVESNYLVYASPVMPHNTYTLKVRVTGLTDHSSKGKKVAIDRVVIVEGSGAAP